MKLPGGLPPAPGDGPKQLNADGAMPAPAPNGGDSMFTKFSDFVDTKNGTLKFAGKAVIHSQGVDFSSGTNFSISLDEVDTLEELGKGNYGTVYKVRHARPRIRKPGLGLASQRSSSMSDDSTESSPVSKPGSGTTGIIMAMKEIRLELDEAKFAAIIMELDILHRCVSPYIIDFYGAFFQEGAVYICIEFMDGGSIDKLYGDGIPENVLKKITYATTTGLKELKDVHNIIHRDVKPTNILVNTRGQVKICDFGVSGNLVASIAKTNIGCQSYMAPERISGGGVAQAGANPGGGTYSVQSDIWSLGLTIIECAMGRYPYPPETYNNIFSQLSVSNALPWRYPEN
jgi:mitogen-activated protein kinase kinase